MIKKLQDIVGNEHAKRAIEVALSGAHDIVFIVMPDSPIELIEATKRLAFENDIKINCIGIKPCPCGSFGDAKSECECSLKDIKEHASKIHTLLRKTSIVIALTCPLPFETNRNNETEDDIMARVKKAISRNKESYTKKFEIDSMAKELLSEAGKSLNLSAVSTIEIAVVARTICNMEYSNTVLPQHIVEAIQYKNNSLARSLLNYSPI
jgi:magnesium chelatase family protein